jgi:hypothetical protein
MKTTSSKLDHRQQARERAFVRGTSICISFKYKRSVFPFFLYFCVLGTLTRPRIIFFMHRKIPLCCGFFCLNKLARLVEHGSLLIFAAHNSFVLMPTSSLVC